MAPEEGGRFWRWGLAAGLLLRAFSKLSSIFKAATSETDRSLVKLVPVLNLIAPEKPKTATNPLRFF